MPEGVEEGPQSMPYFDTGTEWLDQRMNVSQFRGAMSRLNTQKYLRELGETRRIREGDIAMSQHFGSSETEVPLREVFSGQRNHAYHAEVSDKPPSHLFRGMSEEEFQESMKRGYVQSDGRGAIMPEWEGTNAGHDAGTAYSYLPRTGPGRIVKLRVNEDDEWFGNKYDSYARTRKPIPWDRVEAHTSAIDKSEDEF
jgi:hypothetical protein